jgi:pimeloyl-ACP methyl ester carboxylesterase
VAQVQSGIVTVRSGDIALNVLVDGDAAAPPMVFVHGGGLTAHTWRHVIGDLRTDYRCIAFDLRGHGDSEWSAAGDYSLASNAADLATVIDTLELGRSHLVGMSLGGQTVLHAVCDGLPARSIVLVDVGPKLAARETNPIREFLAIHRYPDFESAVEAAARFQPSRSRSALRTGLRHAMHRAEDGTWSWKWDPRRRDSYAQRTAEARALWTQLGEVRCPTLVVRGSRSPVFTAELADELVAALPEGRLATLDTGHNVQSERPTELARLIRRFHSSA